MGWFLMFNKQVHNCLNDYDVASVYTCAHIHYPTPSDNKMFAK